MTTSERIRAAALGPEPINPHLRRSWVGLDYEWDVVTDALTATRADALSKWGSLSNDERRMFLLFVAEAVK